MPLYQFACEAHGPFEVRRPMADAALPVLCATCARPATRLYTPPSLPALPAAVRAGLLREERSRHEPRLAARAEVERGAPLRRPRRGSPPWALGG